MISPRESRRIFSPKEGAMSPSADFAMPGNWRKSRFSSDVNCVEAGNGGGAVLVRDTADRTGPALAFGAQAWAAFTAALKN